MTEDEMVGWHHRLSGCEFEETLDDNGEKRSLVQSTELQRVRQDLVTGSQQ